MTLLGFLLFGFLIYLVYDYYTRRFSSPEDRYMDVYGKEEWESNNMDMYLLFNADQDDQVKQTWLHRLETLLDQDEDTLLRESASLQEKHVVYQSKETPLKVLLSPRKGIYFDLSQPGVIHLIWNHLQMDGVALFKATRTLYDENPPLIPYQVIKPPPPLLPEVLALPKIVQQALIRGSLYKQMSDELYKGDAFWKTAPIKALKEKTQIPFNLLSSATVAKLVFDRHPHTTHLTLGLTVYFPFLKARNRYAVTVIKVKRGSVDEIGHQLLKRFPSPLLLWGSIANQAYLMERVPEALFIRLMKYYRQQIDVLISNVPVAQHPISINEVPTQIICQTRGLSLPYYFLLMGTRHSLHVSYTTRYPQDDLFSQNMPLGSLESTF